MGDYSKLLQIKQNRTIKISVPSNNFTLLTLPTVIFMLMNHTLQIWYDKRN